MSVISTPITELFGIKHPILLAGASLCVSSMAVATSSRANANANVSAAFLTLHPQG
jgi:hypothetical protein